MKKFFSIIPLFIVILLAAFLRFYDLGNNPPGLYVDEVSIGYNAYTILTKGVDEHGEKYPLMFKAFGEYKMPVYIYLTAFAEGIFGKNEFAVRFTSAFSGVASVIVLYFLTRSLLRFKSLSFSSAIKKYLPLVSSFILAISPWHIQFSRGGFEANTALLFYLCALYLGVLFLRKNSFKYIVLSSLFFSLTMYTYFAYRVITPLTLIVAFFCLLKTKNISWREIGISLAFFVTCLLPLLFYASSSGLARFSQTSAFSGESLYMYPLIYLKNYLSYFSLSFLFATGDGIGRHQMPWFGVLPKWEIWFLFVGIFYLLKNKRNIFTYVIFGLLLIAPTAASFAIPSPQSLRALSMVVPLTLLVGIGLVIAMMSQNKLFRRISILVLFLGLIECVFLIHHYTGHYPRVNQLDWGGGYKEIVQAAGQEKSAVFVMDESLEYSIIYFKFYNESLLCISSDQMFSKKINGKRLIKITRKKELPTRALLTKNIALPNNVDTETFAQFWEVKACY